jgi:hypothetical protein
MICSTADSGQAKGQPVAAGYVAHVVAVLLKRVLFWARKEGLIGVIIGGMIAKRSCLLWQARYESGARMGASTIKNNAIGVKPVLQGTVTSLTVYTVDPRENLLTYNRHHCI